ncbi:hypothetical protein TNIN_320331 [Trichonephila inaurata madagascariensis]|uniref:Uncharacterized protein n=1 Tax=Trichonephila inaurata madagascariensis TaxID=2747483 RepID=A0A8X7CJ69_9ARAC|nr:hypothetical protein TNIN_320331 [Trichonephila inaurata madagascariensis]
MWMVREREGMTREKEGVLLFIGPKGRGSLDGLLACQPGTTWKVRERWRESSEWRKVRGYDSPPENAGSKSLFSLEIGIPIGFQWQISAPTGNE